MLEISSRKTGDTRERLLELAESAVLAKGFAATSIEELIAAAGISKSGFFYHFKDKGELAKGLLLRYLEQDRALLESIFRRGDDLNEDPLHGFWSGSSFLPKCWPICRRRTPAVLPPRSPIRISCS